MKQNNKIILMIFETVIYIVSGILLYQVGGVKLMIGVWLFGWGMNLQNKLE